jgi:hypothetical protein
MMARVIAVSSEWYVTDKHVKHADIARFRVSGKGIP